MKGSREGTGSRDKKSNKGEHLKEVLVCPLLKKLLLDPDVIRSLKAFSNVSFEGKIAVKEDLGEARL